MTEKMLGPLRDPTGVNPLATVDRAGIDIDSKPFLIE
jgi:hypothetical protein